MGDRGAGLGGDRSIVGQAAQRLGERGGESAVGVGLLEVGGPLGQAHDQEAALLRGEGREDAAEAVGQGGGVALFEKALHQRDRDPEAEGVEFRAGSVQGLQSPGDRLEGSFQIAALEGQPGRRRVDEAVLGRARVALVHRGVVGPLGRREIHEHDVLDLGFLDLLDHSVGEAELVAAAFVAQEFPLDDLPVGAGDPDSLRERGEGQEQGEQRRQDRLEHPGIPPSLLYHYRIARTAFWSSA